MEECSREPNKSNTHNGEEKEETKREEEKRREKEKLKMRPKSTKNSKI